MSSKKSPQLFGKPDFSLVKQGNSKFRTNYWNAFNYAHYELPNVSLKKETLKYLKSIKSELYGPASDLPDVQFVSVGKFCYIFNQGGDFLDDIGERLEGIIGDIVDAGKHTKVVREPADMELKTEKPVVSIQTRLREKSELAATEIDLWVDERVSDKKVNVKTIQDFLDLFSKHELKAAHITFIMQFFTDERSEYVSALAGTDAELKEAYSHYSKPALRNMVLFYDNLMTACEGFMTSNRPLKKKIKKPTDVNKLVSRLPYLPEDKALGLVSINPVHILGAKEMWVYNTKTRKLGYLKSYDESGLSVKGASIANISVNSYERTLRHPSDMLGTFKSTPRAKLQTFFNSIKTVDTLFKGRLSEHTVILRID